MSPQIAGAAMARHPACPHTVSEARLLAQRSAPASRKSNALSAHFSGASDVSTESSAHKLLRAL